MNTNTLSMIGIGAVPGSAYGTLTPAELGGPEPADAERGLDLVPEVFMGGDEDEDEFFDDDDYEDEDFEDDDEILEDDEETVEEGEDLDDDEEEDDEF